MRHLPEAVQSSGLHMCGNLKSVIAFVLSGEKMVVAVVGAITVSLAESPPFSGPDGVLCWARAILAGFPSQGPC